MVWKSCLLQPVLGWTVTGQSEAVPWAACNTPPVPPEFHFCLSAVNTLESQIHARCHSRHWGRQCVQNGGKIFALWSLYASVKPSEPGLAQGECSIKAQCYCWHQPPCVPSQAGIWRVWAQRSSGEKWLLLPCSGKLGWGWKVPVTSRVTGDQASFSP